MKRIFYPILTALIFIFISISFAQKVSLSPYSKNWQEVEQLKRKRLPKSLAKEVEKILEKSRADRNQAETAKALIYKLYAMQNVKEEALVKSIDLLEKETKLSKKALKSLLHSLLGELYWRYFLNNRYRILKRSRTTGVEGEGLKTWDAVKIVDKSIEHYLKSLDKPEYLSNVAVQKFSPIVRQGNQIGRAYYPTLFDFLANRALEFFGRRSRLFPQAFEHFSLNSKSYLAPGNDFIQLKLRGPKKGSPVFYSLTILQKLMRIHKRRNPNGMAFLNADIRRLQFVKNKSRLDGKNQLYEKALNILIKKYKSKEAQAQLKYYLARFYYEKGKKYSQYRKKYQYYKQKAVQVCRRVKRTKTNKNYPGVQNCRALINQIKMSFLKITMNRVIVPRKKTYFRLDYQNSPRLYLKLLKVKRDEKKNLRYSRKNIKFFQNRKAIYKRRHKLIDLKDYQKHSTELSIPGLKSGYYLLLLSSNSDFNIRKGVVSYHFFDVTSIAYLQRNHREKGLALRLMHRQSGKPLAGVKATFYKKQYDRKSRTYELIQIGQARANQKGLIGVTYGELEKTYFYAKIHYKKESYLLPNYLYVRRPYYRNSKRTRTYFFTDRAIYRPGQKVYFKGIMVKTDFQKPEESKVLKNYSNTVRFYDVNRQKIAESKVKTNEFGSFSGSFIIPKGRLNGRMYIRGYHGSVGFSVEEYKRPKFQLKLEVPKKSYRLGDKVKIKGKVMAFAGYGLEGAKIKYKVSRRGYYPYRSYYYYLRPKTVQLSSGVGQTNSKGEFQFYFPALADPDLPSKSKPVFRYTIYVEAVDSTGETRMSRQYIQVGYESTRLSILFPREVNRSRIKKSLKIKAYNLNGQVQKLNGRFQVFSCRDSKKIIVKPLWKAVDFPRKGRRKLFSKKTNSCKIASRPIIRGKFNSLSKKGLRIKAMKKWKSGRYLIRAYAKDIYGVTIKKEKVFTLFYPRARTIPYASPIWSKLIQSKLEPGQKAEILLASSFKKAILFYEVEHRGKLITQKVIRISKRPRLLRIPILEKYRGNLSVHLSFVYQNRVYSKRHIIRVPWTNKKLDLEFLTFRNKLEPGEKEKWTIKISDKKSGKAVNAEMLATLYDASLDQFIKLYWGMRLYRSFYGRLYWRNNNTFLTSRHYSFGKAYPGSTYYQRARYDRLNWFGIRWYRYGRSRYYRRRRYKGRVAKEMEESPTTTLAEKKKVSLNGGQADDGAVTSKPKAFRQSKTVHIRKNFNETAFFKPQLRTNKRGELQIEFTLPESLTKWRMLGLAHTADLKSGMISKTLIAQKDFMLIPNPPRFFREGDFISFPVKIKNLSKKALKGQIELELMDAVTGSKKSGIKVIHPLKCAFKVKANGSSLIRWKMKITDLARGVIYRVKARAGRFSDGQEEFIPVLKNKMLVTESLPLHVAGKEKRSFFWKKLFESKESKTLRHHRFTLEFTSNPIWYAVQALPYLMEYPHECIEQTFNRYYANTLSLHIVKNNPKIEKVFEQWKKAGKNAFLSKLEKNQELKSVLLKETPWVLTAQSEKAGKKRIANLFNRKGIEASLSRALRKIEESQLPQGGWGWFKGMRTNAYMTAYLLRGFAKLKALGALKGNDAAKLRRMAKRALPHLDEVIKKHYEWLKITKADLSQPHLGYFQIYYLYIRSYFPEIELEQEYEEAYEYYLIQANKFWGRYSFYMQGMISIILKKQGEGEAALKIIASLKEHSLSSDEMGMYWKRDRGYYWYQAPVETHALLIEAFSEVANDIKSVEKMKTWLLKQKQTQYWKTTKATASAVYALMMYGNDWLKETKPVKITLGNQKINTDTYPGLKKEIGSGYFKINWKGSKIKPEMAKVKLENPNHQPAWGGIYWQYFEALDKITPHKTPLSLKKQLFIEVVKGKKTVLVPADRKGIRVGDRVKVRIILRSDRDMEYLHMRDMRASGFEPENVISRYKWQDGLGYYQSTKDTSTDFFFDRLPKGTYVFEYNVRAVHPGDFSNGISSIQCMYAPEFTSHSEGIRVQIMP